MSYDTVFEVFQFVAWEAEGDAEDDQVQVEGIMGTFALNRGRLAERRADIVGLLAQLPTEFRSVALGGGGGWTFLNMGGEHAIMEVLCVLGLGVDALRFSFPREYWDALPGQMPYVEVLLVE